ncbi:hypothetical protein HK101_001908 [Irineochytrium annulatum]|nr:hypothetical protein HK101_001908 [Irineochytrium annulatum]
MAEQRRIEDANALKKHWRRWGPYLSEREWATVREDYSADGNAWAYFPFSHSHKRAYRWGEDGLAGVSDNHQLVCFSVALWNGKDPILKERLFGVTGHEGNHGEDVKEEYFYLDNTPCHTYMKYLYKYPHAEFPYQQLVEENQKRSRTDGEFELKHTGVFNDNKYFDVFIEYAKDAEDVDDICVRVTVCNRSKEPAPCHIVPQIWYRNRWAWRDPDYDHTVGADDEDLAPPTPIDLKPAMGRAKKRAAGKSKAEQAPFAPRPTLRAVDKEGRSGEPRSIQIEHEKLNGWLHCAPSTSEGMERNGEPTLLFADNDTNLKAVYGVANKSKYCKDGVNNFIVDGKEDAVNPDMTGTKAAAWYSGIVPAESSVVIKLRLKPRCGGDGKDAPDLFGSAFDKVFEDRIAEADEFYEATLDNSSLPAELRSIQRQAFAGMLWSKQFYHYVVKEWLEGDQGQPAPPPERLKARNKDWRHLHVDDILSMPDKWEYPFFASWDTAFHTVILSLIDPWFAKKQLILLMREWYLHPNGQIPAYEWNFSDVNPPVLAWAALQIYKNEKKVFEKEDKLFLERMFQKHLLNFTWWVNRKDADGLNLFEGGFLGLDNIAVFNRSESLPIGGRLRQADGTGWMAFFCLSMLEMALELAPTNRSFEDMASKFFEHFLYVSDALSWSSLIDEDFSLWDEKDGFFYDNVVFNNENTVPLRVRSLVGLIPLYAVFVLEPETLEQNPGFKRRMEWFLEHFDFTKKNVATIDEPGQGERFLLSLIPRERLVRVLGYMLDENEFLSPFGIRSLSKFHQDQPYTYYVGSEAHTVQYVPAESDSGLFGGNSNWRGPIWMPTTYLLIESMNRFHHYFGDSLQVECPTGSGKQMPLDSVAEFIMHRVIKMFVRDKEGKRPINGGDELFDKDPNFKDYVLFYEYFNADTAMGLGASHQTGWTGLIAKMIMKAGKTIEA